MEKFNLICLLSDKKQVGQKSWIKTHHGKAVLSSINSVYIWHIFQADLIFSEDEWEAEWDVILRIASATPRAIPGNSQRNDNSCCDSMVTQAK